MGLLVPFQPASADYPNHLATPRPERLRLPSAGWLLILLVALCLIPRALMALRIPSVCPDGVLYIRLAQAIEAGDFKSGFQDMALNTYPLILAVLHRLGLEWQLAAALWGVTISSLVVLPLWGWVRRQFDDRVALVACLLYAVNPKLIEWSPEVMRDPTFWFFFTLAIYWLWRAVSEVRLGYFIVGGAAVAMASLTRIEGLLLLIPLMLWTFWRFLALEKSERRRLAFYVVLCVVVFPAILALANLGLQVGQSGWTAMRLRPLVRLQMCLASLLGQTTTGSSQWGFIDNPLSAGEMIWIFIPTMTRGLSPAFALLMFGGMWGWRRIWARRDNQALFYVAAAVMVGIFVQMRYDRNICPRYALPIVLMALPWAALGLLGLIARLLRVAEWLRAGHRVRQTLAASTAAAVAAISLGGAMTSNDKYFETRQMAADLGRWMHSEMSAPRTLVGPVGITPIVSYYANGAPYRAFFWEATDDSILNMVKRSHAVVVLLQPAKELTQERCDILADRLQQSGLKPLPQKYLPNTCDDLIVLVRADREPRVANHSLPLH